jgi:hypothetical protein
MQDFMFVIGMVVVWYVLNRWILPKMGVQT